MPVSGKAVAVTAGGFVLLYSAVHNATISKTLHSFLAGDPLPTQSSAVSGQNAAAALLNPLPGAGEGGGGSAYSTIQPFISARFNKAAAAGILGNMQIESGFNPDSYNSAEGAIGICQWEHGRRLALQQYAAARGLSETDVNAQLGYFMVEMSSAFSPVYLQLQAVTSPATAATIVDAEYEISAGTTRQARINAAQQIYASL